MTRGRGALTPEQVTAFEAEIRALGAAIVRDGSLSREQAELLLHTLGKLGTKVGEYAEQGRRQRARQAERDTAQLVEQQRGRRAQRTHRRAVSSAPADPRGAYRHFEEALAARPPDMDSLREASAFLAHRRRLLRSGSGALPGERQLLERLELRYADAVQTAYRTYLAALEGAQESDPELLRAALTFVQFRRERRGREPSVLNERRLSLQLTAALDRHGVGRGDGPRLRVRASGVRLPPSIPESELHEHIASTDVASVRRDVEHHGRRHERLRAGIRLIEAGLRARQRSGEDSALYGLFFRDSFTPNRENLRILGRLSRDELRFVFRVAAQRAGLSLSPQEIDERVDEFLVEVGQRMDRWVRRDVYEHMSQAARRLELVASPRMAAAQGARNVPRPTVAWLGSAEGRRFLVSATTMGAEGARRLLLDFDRYEQLRRQGRTEEAEALRERIEWQLPHVLRTTADEIRAAGRELLERDNGIQAWASFAKQFPQARQRVLREFGARPGSALDVAMDDFQGDIEERERSVAMQYAAVMAVTSIMTAGLGGGLAVELASLAFDVGREWAKDTADVEAKEAFARIMQGAALAGEATEGQAAAARSAAETARETRALNAAGAVAGFAVGKATSAVAGRASRAARAAADRAEELRESGLPLRGLRLLERLGRAERRFEAAGRFLREVVPEGARRWLSAGQKLGKVLWDTGKAWIKTQNAEHPTLAALAQWRDFVKTTLADRLGASGDRMERLATGLSALSYLQDHGASPEMLDEVAREVLRGIERKGLSEEGKLLYDAVARYRRRSGTAQPRPATAPVPGVRA